MSVIPDRAASELDRRFLVVALAVLQRWANARARTGPLEERVGTPSASAATPGGTPTSVPAAPSTRQSEAGPMASATQRARERQETYAAQVDGLVGLVRGLVESGKVGADAIVAVVSRGDDALTAGLGVVGVQFPSDGLGRWIGHHPADSADAVRYLDQALARGATHLAVPEPSRWWLDHYAGFAARLARGQLMADVPGAGAVWTLTAAEVGGAAPALEQSSACDPADDLVRRRAQDAHDESVRGLRRWADAVLAPHRRVLVISRGDPALAGRTGEHFPADSDGVYDGHPAGDSDALTRLHAAVLGGAEYLLVPDAVSWWSTVYPDFWSAIRKGVTIERPGTGWLCDLSRCPDLGARPSSGPPAPDQESP